MSKKRHSNENSSERKEEAPSSREHPSMKNDSVFLKHIKDAMDEVFEFTEGIDEPEFKSNRLVQAAVIQRLEVIGEATKRLSMEIRKSHPDIPWRRIAGMRDKLIHDYLGVDIDIVWQVVEKDLPVLRKKILNLL